MLEFIDIGWLGLLISLTSIFFAWYFYKKSRKVASAAYMKDSYMIIGSRVGGLPQNVSVIFNETKVERLTKTTIVFWNDGTDVLHGKDIVDKFPLKVTFNKGEQILDAKIIKCSKDANDFRISIDLKEPFSARVFFDYLDPNDGVVIELLHDSSVKYPSFEGIIKGVPNGIVDKGVIIHQRNKQLLFGNVKVILSKPKIVIFVSFLMGLLMTVSSLLPEAWFSYVVDNFVSKSDASVLPGNRVTFFALGVLYLSMTGYLLWLMRRKFPKSLSPELERD